MRERFTNKRASIPADHSAPLSTRSTREMMDATTPQPTPEERAREIAKKVALALWPDGATDKSSFMQLAPAIIATALRERDDRIAELERRVWKAEADAKVHIEFTANSDRRAAKAEAEIARLRGVLQSIEANGLGRFGWRPDDVARAALQGEPDEKTG